MRLFQREWTTRRGQHKSAWCVSYPDPATGRQTRRTLQGITTKADAKAAAALIFADVQRRALLGADAGPSLVQRNLTLGAMLAEDVERPGVADATRRSEREAAHTPLARFFGESLVVSTLTGADVERFKKRRLADGVKPRTVNLPLQVLRAAINRAVTDGRLHAAPCKIKLLPDRPKERRALTRDEATKLIEAAREVGIGDEVAVLLSLGLRRGELFSVKWGDVDFSRRILHMTTEKRGGASDYAADKLPLNDSVLAVLQRRADAFPAGKPPKTKLVFGVEQDARRPSSRRKPGRPKGSEGGCIHNRQYRFGSKLKRAAKLAGLDDPDTITPHVLRHTCATLLVESGADIKTVQKVMRHRTAETTLRVYAHSRLDTIREAVAGLDFGGAAIVPVAPAEAAG